MKATVGMHGSERMVLGTGQGGQGRGVAEHLVGNWCPAVVAGSQAVAHCSEKVYHIIMLCYPILSYCIYAYLSWIVHTRLDTCTPVMTTI